MAFNDIENTDDFIKSASDYMDLRRNTMQQYSDLIYHALGDMRDLVDEEHEGSFDLYEEIIRSAASAMTFTFETQWLTAVDWRQKYYRENELRKNMEKQLERIN